MSSEILGPLRMHVEVERWPLVAPFRIAGYSFEFFDLLLITLEKDGQIGRGEAAGVHYRNDKPDSMRRQLEMLRADIEVGISRDSVQRMLPPGGARNALDCAVWDLEAKLSGRPAWEIAGLELPRPIVTTFTCGADSPQQMATAACRYTQARAIKLKLTGEQIDAARVREVRAARQDVWLAVDANQGFTRSSFEQLLPVLVEARVELVEQPFPVGQEALLKGFQSPIPIAADESVQCLADMPALVGCFDVVNIKLDKCGGFTEGVAMARAARELGLKAMVGNMIGTSLGMAPAHLIGQMCTVVDLDGPVFLRTDRSPRVEYSEGLIACPSGLWG
ncbi:dipeptide epimerase [Steroidobacter sp. S1-65]|uniref:Dipeptide epimerase n=1 Tax=Steroidobacter gossypii TaxID=2805490 RepID=A0ABS1WZY3_9GAMM|nr:dipeptide epimerase [Steroidobacter gossypii]MBM0106514.1 dipeptide epimerase [Steroidobacter gossypii]